MTNRKQQVFCIMSLFFNVVLAMETNEDHTTPMLELEHDMHSKRIIYTRERGSLLQKLYGKSIAKRTGNDKFSDLTFSNSSPGTYQLEAFESCLKVKDTDNLNHILIINPNLFAYDQSDSLENIVEDLIEKQSNTNFQSIQLLLSLPLYPKEHNDKWQELKKIGMQLSDEHQNSDARKLFEDLKIN